LSSTWVLIFIAVVIGLAFIGFLLKSFARIILVLGITYLLFHLGFLWGADDLNEKLHLNQLLKPDVSEKLQKSYHDFSQRREQTEVVETEKIKAVIEETIQSALKRASNEIQKVDKEKLIQELQSKLQHFDQQTTAQVLEDLRPELAKYHITPEEVQQP
jgi:hypothetical protein